MEKVLPVTYKSQWDGDAVATANDCGPTSIAMILNYFGEKLTSDQVFQKTGADKGLISVQAMQKAITALGYSSQFLINCTPQVIKDYLNQDVPVIALVHYGSLNSVQDKNFKGGHFCTVVGYRDDAYVVNDPNFKGTLRSDGDHHGFTTAEFEKAWRDCALDKNPVNSLIVIKRKATQSSNPATQPGKADMSKILDFLGATSEDAALTRLTEHLGAKDTKCDWGNASNLENSSFLAGARREVSKLNEERKDLVTKDYMTRKLSDLDTQKEQEKSAAVAAAKEELSKTLKPLPNPLVETVQRYTSRKFVLSVLGFLVPLLNHQLNLGMSLTDICTILAPILTFLGAEGWKDAEEAKAKSSG